MSRFGAVLEKSTIILFVEHRFYSSYPSVACHCSDPTSSTVSHSVAAVHKDAEVHAVKLRKRINFGPRHGAVNTAFTDVKPSHDADADRAYSLKMRCLAMIVRLNSNEPLSLAP